MSAHTCRVCGCTDDDCRGCIERIGESCYWVQTNICSACTGVSLIGQERGRQAELEGFTSRHDDAHKNGELARAAACYALPSNCRENQVLRVLVNTARGLADPDRYTAMRTKIPRHWPWEPEWWKPSTSDRVRELIKAGALIAAEIDRLNRLPKKKSKKGGMK